MDDDDTVMRKGAVKVMMDEQRAPLLMGSEVDDVDSMQVVKNPQTKTTVGGSHARVA